MTTQPGQTSQPGQPSQPYRLPAHPPADGTADNLTRWQALIDGSSARSAGTAQTWRNGLAGFVTLLTSALILRGGEIANVEQSWKYIVVALLALGAAGAIWGLWAALKAEAPPLTDVDYRDTVAQYGCIFAHEQSINQSSTHALSRARRRVFAALVLLLAGSVTWWLSPSGDSDPRLQVTWEQDGKPITICGTPNAAPAGELSLTSRTRILRLRSHSPMSNQSAYSTPADPGSVTRPGVSGDSGVDHPASETAGQNALSCLRSARQLRSAAMSAFQ